MLLFCIKVSVKLFLEQHRLAIISVQCNATNLLSTVAFRKAISSHENCMSHSVSILSGTYTYTFLLKKLSKAYFAIALSLPWTGFSSIAWLSTLNSCTRFSNLVAWCKDYKKVREYDQEIP